MKQKSIMITADEVAEVLSVSRNKSYQIINALNKQMKEENPRCIVIRGKLIGSILRRVFMELEEFDGNKKAPICEIGATLSTVVIASIGCLKSTTAVAIFQG